MKKTSIFQGFSSVSIFFIFGFSFIRVIWILFRVSSARSYSLRPTMGKIAVDHTTSNFCCRTQFQVLVTFVVASVFVAAWFQNTKFPALQLCFSHNFWKYSSMSIEAALALSLLSGLLKTCNFRFHLLSNLTEPFCVLLSLVYFRLLEGIRHFCLYR